jgi:hypothetical protein
MSDLSGPRAIDKFLEYLTGYMLPSGSHYAIAKTWYATEMERPGCVWTHTLLIPRESIREIRALDFVQEKFFRPKLRSGHRYTDRVAVSLDDTGRDDHLTIPELTDETVLCGIELLYSSNDPVVAILAKNGTQYEGLSLRLWSQLWPDARPEFTFCTGSLSKRSLQGKPLVLQFGPDRVVRDIRDRAFERCSPSPWVHTLVQDLEKRTALRQFLSHNGYGLSSLADISRLVRIFKYLGESNATEALSLLTSGDFESAHHLVQTVLRDAERQLAPLAFLKIMLERETQNSIPNAQEILTDAIRRSLATAQAETAEFLAASLSKPAFRNRYVIVSAVAKCTDVDLLVALSDRHPALYQAVVAERIDLGYLPSLWSSSLPLLDKIELFDMLLDKDGVNKSRLFEAILDSRDVDLSSEVVTHLSEEDLKSTLEWLLQRDLTIALRPQWMAYLKRYQSEILAWANDHEPSGPLVLILANVVDFGSGLVPILSPETSLGLASVADSLLKERHEVAAFVYVTAAYVNDPLAASHCFTAFAILHSAIAASRLSNRAWQILEHHLVPLPSDEWDACEKLRRSVLHFTSLRSWPIENLWAVISTNTDLFHDFIRTAKAYDPGRSFFLKVRDEGVRGVLALSKQQYKEIKKLLR